MKKEWRRMVSVICMIWFLLAGCSGGAAEEALRVSEYYSGLTKMTVRTSLTAEFEDYAVDFDLTFRYNAQGQSTVEVTKPVAIEGVKVLFEEDGIKLLYDGASLDVSVPEETVISPAAVLPELLRVWSGGIVFEQGKDKLEGTECLLLTYQINHNDTEVLYRTWFDEVSLKPIRAEVFENGKKKISCAFLVAENFN